ncbi:MAG: DUF1385 domain-containing protein [Acidimicrobiales bacterium]
MGERSAMLVGGGMTTDHGIVLFGQGHWGASRADEPGVQSGGAIPGIGWVGRWILWPLRPAISAARARRAAYAWWEPDQDSRGSWPMVAAILCTPTAIIWGLTTMVMHSLYWREAIQSLFAMGLMVGAVAAVGRDLHRTGTAALHGAEHQVVVACMDYDTMWPSREQIAAIPPIQFNCGSSILFVLVMTIGLTHVVLAPVALAWAVPARILGFGLAAVGVGFVVRLHPRSRAIRLLMMPLAWLTTRLERFVVAEPTDHDRAVAERALHALRVELGMGPVKPQG